MKYLIQCGVTISAIILLTLNSCSTEDPCTVPCYYGSCVNNSCNCDVGFEGDSCTIRTVDKYIGNWDGIDSCETNTWGYTATIAASSTVVNQLLISNFGRFGTSFVVYADVTGFTFTIPSQNALGITLSGSGTIDTVLQQIVVSYTASDILGEIDHCNGVWTKQE